MISIAKTVREPHRDVVSVHPFEVRGIEVLDVGGPDIAGPPPRSHAPDDDLRSLVPDTWRRRVERGPVPGLLVRPRRSLRGGPGSLGPSPAFPSTRPRAALR